MKDCRCGLMKIMNIWNMKNPKHKIIIKLYMNELISVIIKYNILLCIVINKLQYQCLK